MRRRMMPVAASVAVFMTMLLGPAGRAGAAPLRTEAPASLPRVAIVAFTYVPDPVVARAGSNVLAVNVDSIVVSAIPGHSITANNGSFNTGVFRGFKRFRAPARVGVFPFRCTVHPFMRGVLVVVP
jgi:plastocyanin